MEHHERVALGLHPAKDDSSRFGYYSVNQLRRPTIASPDAGDGRHRRPRDVLAPLYSPYGEISRAVFDFIHIEPLRDRSELFDWSIEAHTHAGLHQVVLLFSGSVRVALDESTQDMAAPAVIAIPAGTVHSFEFKPDSVGFMLTIADRQLDGSPMGAWLRGRLFETGIALTMAEDPALVERLRVLGGEIVKEQQGIEAARVATIDWLTRTVLVLVARETERVRQSRPGYHASELFGDFRSAVEAHHTEHWPVAKYAQLLHVSESSLNRMCRMVAGTTAFELVQERLELEARRRLTYTMVPIHGMAGDLGFSDPSYFARFFRRRTGLSPREFRSRHQPVGTAT